VRTTKENIATASYIKGYRSYRKGRLQGCKQKTLSISKVRALSKDGVQYQNKEDFTSAILLSCKATENFQNGNL